MTTPAPYTAITAAIKAQLIANLTGLSPMPRIEIERSLEPPDQSFIGIHLVSRTAAEDEQRLAISTTTHMQLRFEIICWRFAMTTPDAMRLRDSLIGDTEVALMIDRSLGGTVSSSWLESGNMSRPPEPRNLGFIAAGQIVLAADVTVRTT